MTTSLALLFLASIVCDVAGQIFFKLGVERLPDFEGDGRSGFLRGLVTDGWLLAGIATYIVELVLWLKILSEAPLSLAFPLASANFLGITLASYLFLNERIGRRHWLGSILVTLGVVLVAGTA